MEEEFSVYWLPVKQRVLQVAPYTSHKSPNIPRYFPPKTNLLQKNAFMNHNYLPLSHFQQFSLTADLTLAGQLQQFVRQLQVLPTSHVLPPLRLVKQAVGQFFYINVTLDRNLKTQRIVH